MDIAAAGQMLTHAPQPLQALSSSRGRKGPRAWGKKRIASFGQLSRHDWHSTEFLARQASSMVATWAKRFGTALLNTCSGQTRAHSPQNVHSPR